MQLTRIAILLYLGSMAFPGFVHTQNNADVPFGYQLVILGLFAYESFKPVWVWVSWFANFGFFFSCFKQVRKGPKVVRAATAICSLLMSLTFLVVTEYHASGGIGHNTVYYWTPIKPTVGYYIWVSSFFVLALEAVLDYRRTEEST